MCWAPKKTTEQLFQGSVITSISLHINLGNKKKKAERAGYYQPSAAPQRFAAEQAQGQSSSRIQSGYLINTPGSLRLYQGWVFGGGFFAREVSSFEAGSVAEDKLRTARAVQMHETISGYIYLAVRVLREPSKRFSLKAIFFRRPLI